MRKLLTAFALSSLAFAAQAANPAPETYTGELPSVLKFAQGSGLTIYKKFAATGGLDGWVVKDSGTGKQVVIYTTPDGNAMLAGIMLDKTGKNLTADYTAKHIPPPDYTPAFDDFSKATKITVGKSSAKAELTVAFDANCGFCKIVHRLLEPAVAAGEIKVNYVPVAILGQDSDQKAAGLLASKKLDADLNQVANGGQSPTSADPALLAKVQANTQLMRKHGFNGTPTVLYKAKYQGEDTVFIANGVPNMPELFQRLGVSGQMDKLKKDPQLERFLR